MIAPIAPTMIIMAPLNATYSGTPYTVQAGDTCDLIAAANDIATD
jgi:LysM repeat protein